MKRILTITTLALSVIFFLSLKNTVSAQRVDISISHQTFYDELSPYGRWIDYPDYGYVWAPEMEPDFQPYRTGGHWVWSDEYDWMWVSDYSWGWAPFHYGRWFHDPFYGWMWMPGYDWSPAWVSWRTGGDYYGWAPIRPGINISIGFGNYNPPSDYWCFAPRQYINSQHIGNYYIDRSRNTTIINTTTIINNYGNRNNVFVNGPRRNDAERYAGRIRPVNFRESNRPGGREFRNNQVNLYRPQIQRNNNINFAPRNFDRYNRADHNNGNAIRGNGNNLPENREGNNRRNVFDRNQDRQRNNETREGRTFDRRNNNPQGTDKNRSDDRRNIFDRNINRPGNNESREARPLDKRNNDAQQPNNEMKNDRRNIFERNTNRPENNEARETRPLDRRNNEAQPPNNDRRNDRRNIFDRNANRPVNNDTREVKPFDRRSNNAPENNNRKIERREMERINTNRVQQPNRREFRNENQPQRQIDRQQQSQPRQFQNHSNETRNSEQRNGEERGGNRGRFERRGR